MAPQTTDTYIFYNFRIYTMKCAKGREEFTVPALSYLSKGWVRMKEKESSGGRRLSVHI